MPEMEIRNVKIEIQNVKIQTAPDRHVTIVVYRGISVSCAATRWQMIKKRLNT